MVKLTDAPIIILEGDEYLSSPIDKRPKFHLYQLRYSCLKIGLGSYKCFPKFDIYIDQFRIFKDMISDTLIYCSEDKELNKLVMEQTKCKLIPYSTLEHEIINGVTFVKNTELLIFGNHNLQNMNAYFWFCKELGVTEKDF